jgi:hypothetical protein
MIRELSLMNKIMLSYHSKYTEWLIQANPSSITNKTIIEEKHIILSELNGVHHLLKLFKALFFRLFYFHFSFLKNKYPINKDSK